MQVLLFCLMTVCRLFRGNCVFSWKERVGSLLPLQPVLDQWSLCSMKGELVMETDFEYESL